MNHVEKGHYYEQEAADYLISHYNLEKTVEEVVQGLNKEVEDYYAKRVPLKEGVRQYLEEFRERKIPMVIATTGDRKNAEAALSRLKVFLQHLRSEAVRISRIFILQHFCSWIRSRNRPGCLKILTRL